MEEKDKKRGIYENEDSTKYGEFVSSYFGWMTSKKQKQRAEELEDITKKKEK